MNASFLIGFILGGSICGPLTAFLAFHVWLKAGVIRLTKDDQRGDEEPAKLSEERMHEILARRRERNSAMNVLDDELARLIGN